MEMNKKKFITGFNAGYILAEFEPQILASLLKNINPINSYISGLLLGEKEFQSQQRNDHLTELEQIRQKNRDKPEKSRN
jgi:hypothetical protein